MQDLVFQNRAGTFDGAHVVPTYVSYSELPGLGLLPRCFAAMKPRPSEPTCLGWTPTHIMGSSYRVLRFLSPDFSFRRRTQLTWSQGEPAIVALA